MYAHFLLASAAVLFGRSAAMDGPSPEIVGTVTCEPYAIGSIDYSMSASAPLGGYRTTVNSTGLLTVDVENPACSLGSAQLFEFQVCDSSLMGYEQTATIHYGHVVDVATGLCLTELGNSTVLGGYHPLGLQDCYYMDDSGQVYLYFALGSPTNPALLTFLREATRGGFTAPNPLGVDFVPSAPPDPLTDFTINMMTPGTTITNILYLESLATCF